MKKIKFPKLNIRKIKKKWIIGGVIVLLIVIAGARFFMMRSRMNQVVKGNTKVNTTVTTGTIQTSVSGTGSISYADTTDIVVPTSLTVDELLVGEGSNVTAGEVIATVDEASLALCLNEVEEAIAEVDDTIASESSSSTSQSIKAGVAGRVKKIYADEDDSVVDIMKEKGALMLLSADDLMMVTLEDATSLAVGDEVVVSSGDTTTDGTIESVSATGTVVTFDDSVFAYEEEVTVADSEGTTIGTGKAYIHQEISVVASSGTISSLNVSLNSNVSASTKVFTLTSSAKSAEYMQAVTEREQLVTLLNTLVAIQVNGGITAPVDGMLQTVNTSSGSNSGSSSQSSEGGFMMDASDESENAKAAENSEMAESVENVEEVETLELAQLTSQNTEVVEEQAIETEVLAESSIETVTMAESEDATTGIMQLSTNSMFELETSVLENSIDNVGTATDTKIPAEAPFGLTGGEGVIYGTTVDMEYADKEDATEWKPCTAEKTEVAAGTWYVRVKATEVAEASAAVKVEVKAAVTKNSEQNGEQQQKPEQTTSDSSEHKSEQGSTEKEETPTVPNDKTESDASNSNSGKENTGSTSDGNSMSGGVSVSRSGSSSSASTSSTTTTSTSESVETTSMFTIANGDKMMVTMNVDELDIGTMQIGLEAEITLDAIEGETFTGTITSVSGNASSSGGSSQYPVEIIFDKTDAMLSGMNASIEVIIEQAENVLTLPISAIQDDGNYSYVYTGYDESTDKLSGKVQVETGLSDETSVEITAGLSEGDTVYYEMQGSEDSTSSNNGMGGFTMPGGMSMPGGSGFPGGGDFPSGGGNRGQRDGMGGR